MVSVEDIEQLPVLLEQTIPEEYMDEYGHMNVRWYFDMWGRSAGAFMSMLGMDKDYGRKHNVGHWLLRQVLNYQSEIRLGEDVAVYARILGRSAKHMHNMYWMVNRTRGIVSSSSEVLVAHADLQARRTTPFLPELAQMLDEKVEEFDRLDWEPPISGAIIL